MFRQILVVALGIFLSFLAVPAGGYVLYRLSYVIPQEATVGQLVRYILNPVIAFLVGACVGALAKSRAGLLAALSLVPWALVFLFFRRQSAAHLIVLLSSVFLGLCSGIFAARVTFRICARDALH